jgi:hypothetical protein
MGGADGEEDARQQDTRRKRRGDEYEHRTSNFELRTKERKVRHSVGFFRTPLSSASSCVLTATAIVAHCRMTVQIKLRKLTMS